MLTCTLDNKRLRYWQDLGLCAVVVDTDGHDVRCIEKSAAFALGPAGGVILGMF